MINKSFCYILFSCTVLISCSQQKSQQRKIADKTYIDSIRTLADTSYTKAQYTTDFAKANYYSIRKDSVLMQVMLDDRDSVRQIITTKNNRRVYFAQFYPNGQLKAMHHFDAYGANDGLSETYHENGQVIEQGNYKSGFRTGDWQLFDSSGKYIEKIKYSTDGQRINE